MFRGFFFFQQLRQELSSGDKEEQRVGISLGSK